MRYLMGGLSGREEGGLSGSEPKIPVLWRKGAR